jgi:3-phenylpropionate/cinnamic acid dioxygenase small subunit
VPDSLAARTDTALVTDVEQFYYREARLLQDLRLTEWLALFAEDATYRIPLREVTRFHGSTALNQDVIDDDLAFDYINETKEELTVRVNRLLSGLAHVEEPQPITTRFITNIEVEPLGGGEVLARSNFHVIRVKEQLQSQSFFGSRTDRLVDADGGWRIAARRVVLGVRVLEHPVSLLL